MSGCGCPSEYHYADCPIRLSTADTDPPEPDEGFNHYEEPDCLDGPDGCGGEVEYRHPLSGTGKAFPRCDAHWASRLERHESDTAKYPDSDVPPAWFDPTYVGEEW